MHTSHEKPVRHNPLTFYLRTLLYMFVALLLRVVTFAPLVSLFIFKSGSYLRYLAVLCPVLFIFFLLPLRFSFAQALVQKKPARFFSFDRALSMRRYGEKLGRSLLHLLSVLKWAIPLLAVLGLCAFSFDSNDVNKWFDAFMSLGKTGMFYFVSITRIFGANTAEGLEQSGGLIEGLIVFAAIIGVFVLILLYGVMRNSAYRYIWAASVADSRNPRAEARLRLRGRRLKQLGVALLNLVLLLPCLIGLHRYFGSTISDVSTTLMALNVSKVLDLLDIGTALAPLIFVFVCLYLPFLPLRRILTAYFATKHLRPRPAADAPADVQAPVPVPPYAESVHMQQPMPLVRAEFPTPPPPTPTYVPDLAEDVQDEEPPAPYVAPAYIPSPQIPQLEDVPPPSAEEEVADYPDDTDPSAFTLGQ